MKNDIVLRHHLWEAYIYKYVYKDIGRVVGEHQMEQKQTEMEHEMGTTISVFLGGLLPSTMQTQMGKNIENEKKLRLYQVPGQRDKLHD